MLCVICTPRIAVYNYVTAVTKPKHKHERQKMALIELQALKITNDERQVAHFTLPEDNHNIVYECCPEQIIGSGETAWCQTIAVAAAWNGVDGEQFFINFGEDWSEVNHHPTKLVQPVLVRGRFEEAYYGDVSGRYTLLEYRTL